MEAYRVSRCRRAVIPAAIPVVLATLEVPLTAKKKESNTLLEAREKAKQGP